MATPKRLIDEKIKKIIALCLKKITNENLRKTAKSSLINFYNRQYTEIRHITPLTLATILALSILSGKTLKAVKSPILPSNTTKERAREYLLNKGVGSANLYGTALQKFSGKYFEEDVRPVLDRLAKQYPIDANDSSGRMSLRGKAEIEVRYQHNLDMIERLKGEGHKLVICSAHADCSDRCSRWQGKVFSLDNTSGTTDDGRKYIPLEKATDQNQVYYTNPKTGTQYRGGLLGYNCRHYLIPYKAGFQFPEPNAKEERKQYEITVRQRQLERNVLKWKTRAIEYKGVDKVRYEFAKNKAKEWDNEYISYSKAHNRAYYPSRTKII